MIVDELLPPKRHTWALDAGNLWIVWICETVAYCRGSGCLTLIVDELLPPKDTPRT